MSRSANTNHEDVVKKCYKHKTPIVYPASYDKCPACDLMTSKN